MNTNEIVHLLYTLIAVYKYGQITEAAKKTGKSISTVSKEINKLKEVTDDPLFIRSNNRMEPTEYTKCIVPKLSKTLNEIDSILNEGKSFSPLNYESRINISLTHILIEAFGDELLDKLTKNFPKATIELSTWDNNSMLDLHENTIDFAIHYNNIEHTKGIQSRLITQTKTVIASSPDCNARSVEQLFENDFIFLKLKGWNDVREDITKSALERGFKINYKFFFDDFGMALKCLNSDPSLAMFLPMKVAAKLKLHYTDWPLPQSDISLNLLHNRTLNHKFVNEVYSIVKEISNNLD